MRSAPRNTLLRFALVALPACVGACSAYDTRYEFEPRPLEVGHVVPDKEDRVASVLVSVIGVRKRDTEQDIPASVELRLRVDSATDDEIRVPPASVQLFAANLEKFPDPVIPGGELVVPARGSGTMTAYFPFPDGKVPGAYDLEGVSVRWTLNVGGHDSTGNATFSRRLRDTGYYPFGIGFGFGVSSYDSVYHHGRYGRGYHSHPRPSGHKPVAVAR